MVFGKRKKKKREPIKPEDLAIDKVQDRFELFEPHNLSEKDEPSEPKRATKEEPYDLTEFSLNQYRLMGKRMRAKGRFSYAKISPEQFGKNVHDLVNKTRNLLRMRNEQFIRNNISNEEYLSELKRISNNFQGAGKLLEDFYLLEMTKNKPLAGNDSKLTRGALKPRSEAMEKFHKMEHANLRLKHVSKNIMQLDAQESNSKFLKFSCMALDDVLEFIYEDILNSHEETDN